MVGRYAARDRTGFSDHDRSSEHAARNDAFRRGLALAPSPHGVPEGATFYQRVEVRGAAFAAKAIRAIIEGEPYTAETAPDNDGYDARERGTVTVDGVRVDWTIVPHDDQGRLTLFGFRDPDTIARRILACESY